MIALHRLRQLYRACQKPEVPFGVVPLSVGLAPMGTAVEIDIDTGMACPYAACAKAVVGDVRADDAVEDEESVLLSSPSSFQIDATLDRPSEL